MFNKKNCEKNITFSGYTELLCFSDDANDCLKRLRPLIGSMNEFLDEKTNSALEKHLRGIEVIVESIIGLFVKACVSLPPKNETPASLT